MKSAYAFLFFMLFLAGIAFVNLRGMQSAEDRRVSSVDQLTGVAWQLSHLGEMVADEDAGIYIQFRQDGQFSGSAGCNRFFGTASIAEDLQLGGIGATRRACPEPANSLEFSFLAALGQTTAASRADNRLAFKDGAGVSVLRFVAIDPRDE